MQSSSGAATYLQLTVTVSRIIYVAAATAQIHYTTTAPRAAAKPAYNNSTALPAATITEPLAPVIANLHAESPLATAPTVSASTGGGAGIFDRIGTVLHTPVAVAASAFGGCVSSAGAFSGGALIATGGVVSTLGPGFLAAVGGACVFGLVGGGIGYFIPGSDTPNSMTSDFRDGMEFGSR